MERDIYEEDHEAFRDLVKDFVKRHVSNESIEKWDAAGEIDRATMLAAGEAGLIGLSVPEEFGGAGMLQDYRFRTIVMEEVIAAGAGSLAGAFGIQDDLAVPYLVHMGTQEQKEKWLPRMATGEVLGALAMTDPGAGSDLRGIKTNAKKVDGGYIVNGAKTFISSGTTADMVVTFVKTGEGNRPDAFSLLILEKGMEGFDQGKKLSKMGFHGWDTAELSFTDVFVPDENLISGKEGQGFIQLMMNLPLERLSIGVAAAAAAQAATDWTITYTKEREAFGERIADFQNTRFQLADMVTTTEVMWAYIDRALLAYKDGKLTAEDAAKVKYWATEREWELLDIGVQLHGGYGYIMEYPIARAFTDARVHRIYGGTNEIMRDLVGRQIAGKR
ncbi:acyl-CoA dehydrogenase family protein [Microbacterium esteraromaticum]|uniref:Acyl-CoA dehydrogenase family protein n=1 Tax=Microbacterium esteraromaticum TaxID=57043 RepID=A0A939DU50_9MICO|nr:acyl-CoA dehydrogenase family protein [Microbacterium esteraromaticum]MBN8205049.1 acyl-CoA dehydrogenase family protein [Microbacterium esteraromaticum]MBN8415203.1 acyl-CoA dehydrogenase family protein [Microbacterium esteraromaticum]MBN8424519.1 acyl-CoA dehydrogenase family protein [Microbacterium esteraromaticum]MBY6060002.1 acyl-CoA dehydrogenase family protein [Microbacterium esteraromaticum]MCA1307049.1 acyl-CoA dehydrogenase family protein [Microbacterium esteraromaticum]